MKKYLKRFLSLGAAAVLAAALAGCSDLLSSEESDNSALIAAAANSSSSSSDGAGTAAAGTSSAAGTSAASASVSYGKATASLFVPDYAALAGKAKASSSARAVAPQTSKVVLTYGSDSTVAGSVTLDDATKTDATNASGVAGTAYTFSFELPVGTYSAGDIVISLYDDDDTLLSSGKNAAETTITEGEDTAESVTLLPNASDSNKSGSLAAGEMKFISTTLTAAKIKAFAVTGDVTLFIFDSTGKLVSSDSPVTASSGYALIPAQTTGGTYYLGIYNATESEISSYEVSDDGVQSLTGSSSWDAVSVDFSSYSTITQIDVSFTLDKNVSSATDSESWWLCLATDNYGESGYIGNVSWASDDTTNNTSTYTASITSSDAISAITTANKLYIYGNLQGAGKITVTVTGASSGTVSITAADSATSVAVGSLLKLTSDVAATWSTESTSYVVLYSDSDGTTEITSGSTYTDVYVKGIAAADSVTITASASGYTAGEISLEVVAFALKANSYTVDISSEDTVSVTSNSSTATYTSSNKSVFTVGTDGTLTGVALGTATLTATSGSATAEATVTVKQTTPTASMTFDFRTNGIVTSTSSDGVSYDYGVLSGTKTYLNGSQHGIAVSNGGTLVIKVAGSSSIYIGNENNGGGGTWSAVKTSDSSTSLNSYLSTTTYATASSTIDTNYTELNDTTKASCQVLRYKGSDAATITLTMSATAYFPVIWVEYYEVPSVSVTASFATASASIDLNGSDTTYTQAVTATASDSTTPTVAYSSSQTDVATVDSDGKVTAVGMGVSVITATVTHATETSVSEKATYYVVVKNSGTVSEDYSATLTSGRYYDGSFKGDVTLDYGYWKLACGSSNAYGYNTSGHGIVFKNGNNITLTVKAGSVITITNCRYDKAYTLSVTDASSNDITSSVTVGGDASLSESSISVPAGNSSSDGTTTITIPSSYTGSTVTITHTGSSEGYLHAIAVTMPSSTSD